MLRHWSAYPKRTSIERHRVGDADHLKVFANPDAAETWLEEHDPEGAVAAGGQTPPLKGGLCTNISQLAD
jgi:hypothetical protein